MPTMRTAQSASTPSPNIIRWNAGSGVAERGGGYEVWRADNFSGNSATAVTAHAELIATVGANQLELADLKTNSVTSTSFIYWVRAFNTSVPQTSSGVRKAERRYYSDFNDDSDYSGVGQGNAARLALKALEESITMSFTGVDIVRGDEQGNNLDFSEVGGQIVVEIANLDITAQCTFTKTNLSGFTSSQFTINASGAYTVSGMSGTLASLDITAAIPANATTGLSTATSVTKKYILRVQKGAIAGRSVSLDWPLALYDETGQNPSPSSVTITALPSNTLGTVYYQFLRDTGSGLAQVQASSTTSTYTYSYPTNYSQAIVEKIQVKIREDSASAIVRATNTMSSPAIKEGDTGSSGIDAYTVRGTNENHTFVADTTGAVSMTGFSCDFTVRKGPTLYTYQSSGTTANTFRYGTITATNVTQVVNSTSGQITLAGGSAIATGLTVATGSLQVPIIDAASGVTVTTVLISFSKSIKAAREGGIFTFEENTNSSISAANASDFAGTLTNAAAQAAATAVIAASIDGFLRPNDRVTITDNSADKAGTRIYNGTGTTSAGAVAASDFSSLVVETFSGSVIVDGTLSADKLAANTTTTNTLNVGSNLVLANAGQFYTTNKTSYSDTDAGFFLGWDGSKHQLNLGNNTDYIKWDGSNLQVAGSIFFDNASSIGISSFSNDSGFTDDTAANAAQNTANTGVSNAATAQSTANTGVSNAATAQNTANTASTNATDAQNKSQNFDTNGDISLGINVGTSGHIRGGQTGWNTGSSGFFLGYSSGYKFSIGNPSGNRLTWNGSTLFIQGSLRIAGSSTTLTETNTLNSNTSKTDVGLQNVDNKSSSQIRGEITSGNITNGLGFTPYNSTNPSGFTTFDASGVQDAITNNVTTIDGSKITTGTINAAQASIINIDAANISTGTLNANRINIDGITLSRSGNSLIIKGGGVDTTQVANDAITEHTMDHFNDKEVSKYVTSYQTLGTSQSISGHAATMVTKATVSVIALDNNTYGTGDGINFSVKVEELRNGSIINNTTYTDFAVRDANVSTVILPLITTISSGFTYTYRISGKVNSSYGSAEEVKWLRPTVETTMLKR